MNILQLNEAQTKGYINIKKFLQNTKQTQYLLLGPAGSGKTTVIVNAFKDSNLKIAFCAFTNKATQVLKKIADKFDINFKADFMTIHKLLMLEPKYLDKETEVAFKFDKTKIEHLKEYNVIIFDECSTISKELYKYICEAAEYMEFSHQHTLKYIFLGDFWQLPPVGEEKSIIFELAIKDRWLVNKLEKVMRSSNKDMALLNKNLIAWIPRFKLGQVNDFVKEYPYNLLIKKSGKYLSFDNFLEQYLTTWRTVTPDTVILTYSRSNCDKTNQAIQDRIDMENNREVPENRNILKFYVGDRCCLDRPIEVYSIKEVKKTGVASVIKDISIDDLLKLSADMDNISLDEQQITNLKTLSLDEQNDVSFRLANIDNKNAEQLIEQLQSEPEENEAKVAQEITSNNTKRTVFLDSFTGETLYNGEIFDILATEDVLIKTPLNRFQYMNKTFEGQILKLRRINDDSRSYEILHIPEPLVNDARALIKEHERRMFYLQIMNDFIKKYPKLDYGYCITIYKSQGSEWHTVLVNLNSIKWSIIGKSNIADMKKKMSLFKTTYTAMSRASAKLYCFWNR